jgi:Mn2+/Fe2+ NRAMP family transporter
MTPERRKPFILHSVILCGMIVCLIFSFRHFRHHEAFNLAAFVLMLISFSLQARFNLKHRRQPDTLTHLFPNPSENEE